VWGSSKPGLEKVKYEKDQLEVNLGSLKKEGLPRIGIAPSWFSRETGGAITAVSRKGSANEDGSCS